MLKPAETRHYPSDEEEEEEEDEQSMTNMELTEMAMPRPVRPEDPRRPSLESAERRATRRRSSREAEPGEVVIPEPAEECDKPFDEGNAFKSPGHDQNSKDEHKSQGVHLKPSALATELYSISWLILFSLLGTLARLGVAAITDYPNSPVLSRVLWANLGGSFILGFLAEDRRLFGQEWGSPDPKAPASTHGKVKKTIPLYIGLATGFCGSFTSFSSFIRDAFLALTNDLQPPSPTSPYHVASTTASRSGGFSFLALLAILIIHPAISLAGLQVGAQLALALLPFTPTIPIRFTRKVLDPLAVFVSFGCWLAAVLLAIWPPGNDTHWRFRAVLPMVFAPPGCLLRFYASRHMNAIVPAFPLGTFAANILGTAVLGMAFDLQHARSIGASDIISCSVLQGIMEGFCGCLTTVSTWVAELNGLRRRHGWVYGFTSVGVALSFMVVIMGSMGWTQGFATPICS
jgi:fluoride ion exporter CrcB/FEX